MATFTQLTGNAVITGTPDADLITTGAGNDYVNAGGGANTINVGDGTNTINAGSGDDNITSGSGTDVITAGDGNNTIDAGGGGNSVTTGVGNDDITTGAGNDWIYAGSGNNIIRAGDGTNSIYAAGGNDNITSGSGDDQIDAGAGANVINAGGGNNYVNTTSGSDNITTGAGNDNIFAGGGNNIVNAGAGTNTVYTDGGSDVITTLGGADNITSGAGIDLIDTGGGSDVVDSREDNDVIVHRIAENVGAVDRYNGGSGIDTLRLDLSSAEWARADVQSDVAGFLARTNPSAPFQFTSTNLRVENIERLEVFVNGVLLINPANEAVTAVADSVNATEETPTVSVNLLANDSVPDRAVSVTLLTPSTLGTVSLVTDLSAAVQTATLSFVPSASLQSLALGQTATQTLQYRVQDVNGDFSVANVTITVTGTNDVPVAAAAVNSVNVPATIAGNLSATDADAGETATLVYAVVGAPPAGLVLNPNGSYSFDASSYGNLSVGQTLVLTIPFTATDVHGAVSNSADLVITLTGTNDVPVAFAAVNAVDEDAFINGNVSATDADVGETATLTYALVGAPPVGLSFNSDGSYTFDASSYDGLKAGETLALTIPFTATDINGATSNIANLVITVTGTNDVPVAQAAAVSVAEDAAVLTGSVVATDVDANAVLSYALDNAAPAGLSFNTNGSYTFDPGNAAYQSLGVGQSTVLTIPYTVTDDQGATSGANLVITVTGTNDAPVAQAASQTVAEDAAVITGSVVATDVDANAVLSYALDNAAPAGLNFNTNGSYTFDPSDAAYQSLGVGQSTVLTIPYTVTDDQGATSGANLVITVTGTNDAPVAQAASQTVAEDAAVITGSVVATDVDANAVLSYALDNAAPAGLNFNTNGSYTFDPSDAAYQSLGVGQSTVLTIPYTVTDDQGATSGANLVITVTGTNDAPVAQAASQTVAEDAAVITGSVVATDVDANAVLSYALDNAAPAGLSFNTNGSYTFDPSDAAYQNLGVGQSTVLTIPYTVTDDQGATSGANLVITVTGTNDAPVAQAASQTVAEDAAVITGSVVATDVDANAVLSYALDNAAPAGLNFNTNGSYTFDPSDAAYQSLGVGQSTVLTIPYTVTDDQGATSGANLVITVTGTNDAPVAQAASQTVAEDAAVITGSVVATDVDANAVLSYALDNAAPAGLSFNTNGSYTFDPSDAAYQNLGVGQSTVLTIPYTVTDDQGATSGANLVITVTGTNDAPVAQAASQTVAEDAAVLTGSVVATDVDANAVLSYALDNAAPAGLSFNTNGSYTFDPGNAAYQNLGVGQSTVLTIPYTVTDDQGATSGANLVITVTGTNDAPVAQAASQTVAEDAAVITGSVVATDVDANAVLSYALDNAAPAGLSFNTNGSYTFDPSDAAYQNLGVGQSTVLTIPYTVTDDQGATSGANLVITVTGTNDAPVAQAASQTVAEDAAVLTGSVVATDVDANAVLSYALDNAAPAGLSFNTNGSYTFDPGNAAYQNLGVGQSTVLTIPYTVTDDQGATSGANLVITVTGTNDAPVAQAASQTVAEDAAVITGSVVATDVDANAVLSYALDNAAPAGLSFNTNGSYTFDPSDAAYQNLGVGQSTVLTIPYTVTDDQGATSGANLVITVTGTNDIPTITGTTTGAVIEAPSTVPVPSTSGVVTVTDADTGESAAQVVAPGATTVNGYGTYSVTAGGVWTYQLNNAAPAVNALAQGATLTDTFLVTSQDGSATQTITVSIIGSNDAPVAQPASFAVAEDATGSGNVIATDVDNGASLSYVLNSPGSAPAGLTFNGDGSFTFDAESYDSLADGELQVLAVPYTVTDDKGASSTANLVITITGTNDAPTLQAVAGISYTDTAADDSFGAASGTLVGQDVDNGASLSYGIDGGTAGSYTVGADSFDLAKTGAYGTLYLNASTGAYRFVPDDSAIEALKTTTTETFTLTVSDGIAAAPTQQPLVVTLNGANDTPEISVAGPIGLSTNEDTSVGGSISATDRDAGDTLAYTVSGAASNGTATVNPDGSYSYQPNANFFGTDSFTLQATDGSGASGTVVVNVAVASVADTDTLTPDTGLSPTVLTPGGNLLVGTGITGQSGFHVATDAADAPGVEIGLKAIVRFGGTYSLDPADTTGRTYLVDSGRVDQGPAGFNQPTAADDGWARWNYLVSLGADTDSNGGSLRDQTYTFAITRLDGSGSPTTPAISFTLAQYLAGAVTANAITQAQADAILDGTVFQDSVNLEFVPGILENFDPRETGSFRISITATDSQGVQSLSNAIVVKIVNSAPVAADESFSTNEDTAITFTAAQLLGNDSDVNGQALRIVSVGNAANGSVVINPDGTVTFTPNANYNGPASFDYVVGDGQVPELTDTGSVTLTVNPQPDNATIGGTTSGTVTEDGAAFTGIAVVTDPDAGENELQPVTAGTPGSNNYGSFEVLADGTWTYTLNNALPAVQALSVGQSLSDSITVLSEDGTASQVLSVTINGSNDTPALGFEQGFETNSAGVLTGGSFGALTLVSSTAGIPAPAEGGQFALMTEAGGAGPFTRFDGYRSTFSDGLTAEVKVYLDVNWALGSGFDYSVAANGSDGNHQRDFIFHVAKDTSSGQLIVAADNNTNFAVREDLDTLANKAVVSNSGWYTLQHVFRDAGGVLAVDMNLIDANGNVLFTETRSAPADTIGVGGEVGGNRYGWFTDITVPGGLGVDALSLGADSGRVSERSEGAVDEGTATLSATNVIPFTDVDLADTHTVSVSGNATPGYLGTLAAVVEDASTADGRGMVRWTFNASDSALESLGAGQSLTQTYTVTLDDGQGGTASKTVSIVLTGSNDVPVITGTASGNVAEDGTQTASGTLTVADPDAGQSLLVAVPAGTAGDNDYGTFEVSAAGDWVYTLGNALPKVQALAAGDAVTDSITVQSADGTATQTITVTITGTNDVPVITGTATGTVAEDLSLQATGTLAITDADALQSSFQAIAAGTPGANGYGNFTVTDAGAWTYDLNNANPSVLALKAGETLTDSIVVQSQDGTASQTISVTIQGVSNINNVGAAAFVSSGAGFRIIGANAGDTAGFSVASAGDFNGDGYDDLVLTAPGGDGPAGPARSGAGEAIIVFGKASGFGDVDVNAADFVSSGKGLRIYGATAGDGTDMSVSGGADVNGDGFDDIILGTRVADTGVPTNTNEGEAIVVLGRGGPAADIDLASPLGTGGFRIIGDDAGDAAGRSVELAGDINGDGLADMMIGADAGDGRPGFVRSNSGEVVVLFGSTGAPADVDLNTGSGNGFRIFGATASDNAGYSVSAAGDVNGDGYGDLLVGVPLGDGQAAPLNRSNSGEAVVVFGKASGFVDIDLNSNLAALGTGITIYGADVNDNLGRSVSSAGDINGDGYDDLVLGADLGDGADGSKTSAGEAVVVFGKASGWANIDVASLSAASGFRIFGADAGDEAGNSVSSAGDVNGDGYDDLLIGSLNGDGLSNAGNNEGEAVLVFGKAGGFGDLDLADNSLYTSGQALRIFGANATDLAGASVSAAGDINGDGFDDLIVGARGGDGLTPARSNAGEAIVVFGGNLVAGDIVLGTAGSDTPIGTAAAERFVTGQGNDTVDEVGTGDVVQAGSGDDNVFLGASLDFLELDGGSGQDTLFLTGGGQTLNLTLAGLGGRVSGFETINITGSGNNTLSLDAALVLDVEGSGNLDFTSAGSVNNLVIEGDVGDQVTLTNDGAISGATWALADSNVGLNGIPGGGYNIYELQTAGGVAAVVGVNDNVTVI